MSSPGSRGLAAPSGYLQTASSLHAFNRYEIKYLAEERDVPRLREALAAHMAADEFSPVGGYPVTSLYYDTRNLRFYWEKIEGLRFRRKLRVRLYGRPSEATDATPVYVEIKQRVNRVTQKRRIQLPYAQARQLCDERRSIEHDDRQRAFVGEVSTLVGNLDLVPTVTTGYLREAFVGTEADLGLRVTIDHRVHGRDRDFHFASTSENRFIIPPHLCIVEIKANERVPYWVTDLTARLDMSVVRVSKYCQSVEAFGLAPRSRMHGLPENLTTAPADVFDTRFAPTGA
ncbi:vacuolar transporter [Prescottella equi]|uniref:polyphosphate polymerase domain-containing protein n=1 Tax=Rhodococcus hoagii TaxID=43767 RepID=UPI000A1200CA|nr:polyphosphate polymerase domain-containing protein [Prescottella equi]NKS32878.1 VTC domain-containing protein [Prescottella equi]ORL76949.1 vacuolar transporter [Prescottella equi]ORL88583.1 vacuolar transporter [Prescottella equi]ORM16400.1 vacuolar transporter [Prescottella equi]